MVEISKDKTIISAIWNEDYEMEYDEPEIEIEALLANQIGVAEIPKNIL